jgi:hypothetical protein
MPLRECRYCGLEAHTEEDLSQFSPCKKSKHGKKNVCFPCDYKHRQKKSQVKRKYGLTLEQYEEYINKGNCSICGCESSSTNRLVLDHDHDTGKVRDVLCDRCNHILGHAQDNIEVLKNAILYLKLHNAQRH